MTINQKMDDHNKWITSLAKKFTSVNIIKQRDIQKEAVGNTRQDESRPVLEQLMNEGYDTVQWDSSNSMHGICRELHNQIWNIEDFISDLEHDAPMFEKTHPGDSNCYLVVTGPGMNPVTVNSYGLV